MFKHATRDKKRLEQFDRTVDRLRGVWEPRLDVFVKKFGKDINVHPTIEPGRRGLKMEFESKLARITLRFGVSPDAEVRKLVFTYEVDILPVLMEFNSHDKLELPLETSDEARFAEWLDERIVDFVHTYLALHENQYYLQPQMVVDPIAEVQFPKFAAAAKLERNGQTVYFIDQDTFEEYRRRNSSPTDEPTASVRQSNSQGSAVDHPQADASAE
jgi:YHS domain-containing protein